MLMCSPKYTPEHLISAIVDAMTLPIDDMAGLILPYFALYF